jgi:hypothetical protein
MGAVKNTGNFEEFPVFPYILRLGVFGGIMLKNHQFDRLNRNYDRLEIDKKDTLLRIGENLLNIQMLINNEKLPVIKSRKKEFKNV